MIDEVDYKRIMNVLDVENLSIHFKTGSGEVAVVMFPSVSGKVRLWHWWESQVVGRV